MKFSRPSLFLLFCVYHTFLYSQNYVANPSFENIASCPDDFFQIYKSPPWFSPNCEPLRPDRHGYAILFTSAPPCASQLTGVPRNVVCDQNAHSGRSYAGIEIVSARTLLSVYRQYLETKLQWPLAAGKKYLISMFYNVCFDHPVTPDIICFKTDSLGIYLSETIIDKNPDCQVIPVSPQVRDAGKQISPSSVWYELTGCFTASGNEQYLTIGNFAGNTFSNCSSVDSIGYFLFVDDVLLIPETEKQIDTVICDVTGWTMDARKLREEYLTLGGWEYRWTDGSTDIERKFNAPGNYTLNVTRGCFTDVYRFNIGIDDCNCKEYIPNTFTPNGDNVNDHFFPHVMCRTQQITSYRFSVFNRWGIRIFSTSSQSQSWDGTYMGQFVPDGQYIYVVEYRTSLSQEVKRVKGTVMVLR